MNIPSQFLNCVKVLGYKSASLFVALLGLFSFFRHTIQAETVGKVDVGAAFIHLDILESGHTVKTIDMPAIRADANYCFWKGFYIKPTVLYGNGGSKKGGIFTGGLGLGHYTPLNSCFAVAPSIGIQYTHIWTRVDFPFFALENLQEKFKSWSPYLALELYYTFTPGWRLSGSYQYAWSRTKTTIEHIVKNSKSKADGPNYGILLEHDLNDQWSLNLGAAYNISLSKEKHGIRASGVKFGVARWF